MKVNVLDTIKDYEGKEVTFIKNQETKELAPITWRFAIFTALNNFQQGETPTNEVKAKCFELSTKIYASSEPDFSLNDRSFIIDRLGKIWDNPLIYGRAKEVFEEDSNPTS